MRWRTPLCRLVALVAVSAGLACSGGPSGRDLVEVTPPIEPATPTPDVQGIQQASVRDARAAGGAGTRQPAATPAPRILLAPTAVTLSDDRSEVRLHVGDRVAVKLGPSPLFDSQGDGWDFSLSDPGVLSKLNAAAGPPGPEAVFEARREGHTRLQGTWHLVCQDIATPCSRPSQAFVLEVQVESR